MEDDLFDNIKIFLSGQRAIQFFREIGMTYLDPNDLNPASRSVWGSPQIIETPYGNRMGGLRGDIPADYAQACLDVDRREQQRQKAAASVVPLTNTSTSVQTDEQTGDVTIIQAGAKHILIPNHACVELAGILLAAKPATPAPISEPTPATVVPPKFQGNDYSIQARRNAENMKRALRPEAQADMRKNWHDQPLPSR